jgi:hypothetical protein
MRALLLIPIVLMLAAGVGYATCLALGVNPHVREMLTAGAALLLASELALVPLLLTRHSDQLAVSQAGLVGSMVHLFIAAAMAAVVLLGGIRLERSFLYWLFAFYFMTLLVLVGVFAKAIRSAPTAPAAGKH